MMLGAQVAQGGEGMNQAIQIFFALLVAALVAVVADRMLR